MQLLNLVLRDYIETWYGHISADTAFLLQLRASLQKTIVSFANQCVCAAVHFIRHVRSAKEMDWVAFVTTSTVAELMAHLKYFRVAHKLAELDATTRLKKVILLSMISLTLR